MYTRIPALVLMTAATWMLGQAPARAQDTPQPRMLNSPLLITIDWDKGTGEGVVHLRNDSRSPISCALSATVTAAGKTSRTTISFLDAQRKAIPAGEVILAKEATTPITTVVADALDSNESEASIFCNGGKELGKLRLWRMPLNITLDGQADKIELSLVDDQDARIVLKNDDPVGYPIAWKVIVGGTTIAESTVKMQPKGATILNFKPSIPFRFRDLLKENTADGELLLFHQPASGINPFAPVKRFPIRAALSRFNPSTRDGLGYVVILLILVSGGLVSLTLTHALPNRLEALNVREKINSIARTTADLSSHVDSRVAVLVRIERIRLRDLLRSRTTFSPDFANVLEQCNAGLTKLSSRVTLLQQIDLVYGRLTKMTTRPLPPSRVDEVIASIDKAQVFLQKAEPSDADLQAAQAATAEAAGKVSALDQQDPGFGQTLALRVKDLLGGIKTDLETRPKFIRMNTAVPGPLQTLRAVAPGIAIPADRCAAIDMALEKLALMCAYVTLAEGTTDPAMLKRLNENERALLDYLQLDSLGALRFARLLMREMKEDVYPVRIEQALCANPMEVSIDMDPRVAYDRAPLTFCLCFNSYAVNTSAAREEWTCDWNFGDDLAGSGRSVSHYFELPRGRRWKPGVPKVFQVTAMPRDPKGRAVIDPATKAPLVVGREITILPTKMSSLVGERTWVEGLKLAAALLVAVFALISGAKDQLLKLDLLPGLVAVFLVGFTADTVKNLLTSK